MMLACTQNGARFRARLFELNKQRLQALANLRVARRGQTQLLTALQQALGQFLEGVEVFAQQEHRFRAHTLHGQELVGRLADALRQHHQLASGRNVGRWRVLLQLERRHGLGDLQQIG